MEPSPQRTKLNNMFCVGCVTLSFYVLHDLKDRLEQWQTSGQRYSRAHEKLYEDINEKLNMIVPKLARRYWEYIVLSCAGEARHASVATKFYIKGLGRRGARATAALNAIAYNPWILLDQEVALFGKKWEGNGYGGVSWQKIAGAGKLYGTVPDAVFIDHVVDLTHNGGLFLDKGFILACREGEAYFLNVLTVKAQGSLLDPFSYRGLEGYTWKLPGEIYGFIERGNNIGLLPNTPAVERLPEYDAGRHWGAFVNSEDIEWGTKSCKVVPHPHATTKTYVTVYPNMIPGMILVKKKGLGTHNYGWTWHKPIWLKTEFDGVCLRCGQATHAGVYLSLAGVKHLIKTASLSSVGWGGKKLLKEKAYEFPNPAAYYLDTHPYFWENRIDPDNPLPEPSPKPLLKPYVVGCTCNICKAYVTAHKLDPTTGEPLVKSDGCDEDCVNCNDDSCQKWHDIHDEHEYDSDCNCYACQEEKEKLKSNEEATDGKIWEGQAQETEQE